MTVSNRKAVFSNDVHRVWEIVLDVDKYSTWRSDLSKAEMINEKKFIEYTKEGYATIFTITVSEPYKRWEFDMENSNMKGHWIGIFTDRGNETEIDLTEAVTAKKFRLSEWACILGQYTKGQIICGCRLSCMDLLIYVPCRTVSLHSAGIKQ